jgi:hypothetical protein
MTKPLRDYHARTGEIPQWSPYLFSGMPSYGSMMYPPTLRIDGFLNRIKNEGIRFWVILSSSGIALYCFLVRQKLGVIPCMIGVAVFLYTPYTVGLMQAGHNNKIWATAYIPVILLCLDYLWKERSLLALAFTCLAFGGQIGTNHPQVVYYTYMLVFVWYISRFIARRSLPGIFKEGGLTLAAIVIGILFNAQLYLSVWEYQKYSARGAPSVLTGKDYNE